MVVKTPVDSTTYSAPASAHLMLLGSRLRRDKTVRASPRDARFRPPEGREGERYLLLEDGDSVPVNHEFPILSLDSAPEVTMSRVIFEHVNLAKRGGGGGGGGWKVRHPGCHVPNRRSAYTAVSAPHFLGELYSALPNLPALCL